MMLEELKAERDRKIADLREKAVLLREKMTRLIDRLDSGKTPDYHGDVQGQRIDMLCREVFVLRKIIENFENDEGFSEEKK